MKTIWHRDARGGGRVYFSSHFTRENLIIVCANCQRRFRGSRSFQMEMSAARRRAEAHAEVHGFENRWKAA